MTPGAGNPEAQGGRPGTENGSSPLTFSQDDLDDAYYLAYLLAEAIIVDQVAQYCNGRLLKRFKNVSLASAIWDDLEDVLERPFRAKTLKHLGKKRFQAAADRWAERNPQEEEDDGQRQDRGH